MTDYDLRRLIASTQRSPTDLVRWVTGQQIELDHEPEAFVRLRTGKRVMTLRHGRSGCIFLDPEQRCTVYEARPLGCRVFPFDSKFDRTGKLVRLELIQATECPYDLTGRQQVGTLRARQAEFLDEIDAYQAKVAAFNRLQQVRKRKGRSLMTGLDFFRFLGLSSE